MPESFAESSNGLLLIANGIDRVLRWNGQGPISEAGLDAPATAISIAFAGVGSITGQYFAYQRFVDDEGNVSNLSPVSPGVTASSASVVTYGNLTPPNNPRVTRRQLLRNTAGQTTTFYVDVDTQDLTGLLINSNNVDSVLQTNEAVPLLDTDGSPLANRFTPPPSDRAFLAQHLTRMFAAGERSYAEGCVRVQFGSTQVSGIGTAWPTSFAGRFLYVSAAPKAYEIASVSGQTLTLTAPYLGPTDPYADYSVRPAPATRNSIYYSEPGLPEAWPATNAIDVTEDGDEVTGLMPMSSFLYILKRKHTYRFTAQSNPAEDGFVFLSARRGCVNNRCWVTVGSDSYMLDESGVHFFNGSENEDVSRPIGNVFSGEDPNYRINWAASRFFHAVKDELNGVIRWFVCMSGDYLPRHALCLQVEGPRWWVERYPSAIGCSYLGREGRFTETWRTQSGETVYLGSEAKRMLALGRNALDGPRSSSGVVRGRVRSATLFTLVSVDGPFPARGMVGSRVDVVKGAGKGQSREIESVSGDTLRLTRPWTVLPDSTSVFQLGGVGYQYRSGKFQFNNQESRNPRSIRVAHRPSKVAGDTLDLRVYQDWDEEPVNWYTPLSKGLTYGLEFSRDSPDAVMDLTKSFGHTSLRSDGHRDSNLDSPRTVTFELRGTASEDGLSVRQIVLEGVSSGSEDDG